MMTMVMTMTMAMMMTMTMTMMMTMMMEILRYNEAVGGIYLVEEGERHGVSKRPFQDRVMLSRYNLLMMIMEKKERKGTLMSDSNHKKRWTP